ncbi:class I SAM-dependent methyltransferase [Ginsengibacter hankyongi]|nr:class I SAM-dependent methyltransferase [Ginsengibacter hankyongi]
MKKTIKRIFSIFGLELRRVPKHVKIEDNEQRPITHRETSKTSIDEYKVFEINSPIEHNTENRMNDFFSDAKIIEQYLVPSRLEFYRSVIATAQQNDVTFYRKSIVDVGCGTGHLLSFLSENFPESNYSGIDFSEAALLIAKKTLPTAVFKKANIYEKLNEKFDIVICTEVLEHLTNPDSALLNLLEGLKPGGVCILSVPNGRIDNYDGHINFWSPESWKIYIERHAPEGSIAISGELGNQTDLFAIVKTWL